MVKTKILLVEDDKSLREIYGVRLYSEGYDIISAGDGEEALAMAIKERPTLIISDVMMPKISGFDMLDILRSTTETKNIRVIMMTALSSEDQRARGEALGADRYLVKSQVGIEDVVRTVHEVLGDAPVSSMSAGVSNQAPAAPAAPAAPLPTPLPGSTPNTPDSALPQPTAPFSTDRPASLGDRVIHPLQSSEPAKDFGALMGAELNNSAQPTMQPVFQATPPPSEPQNIPGSSIPPIPAAPQAPLAPDPITPPANNYASAPSYADTPTSTLPPTPTVTEPGAPVSSGMSFEETTYAPTPVTPPTPASQQAGDSPEPSLVIPPRPTPGV